jgi:hypothetical protein
VNQRFRHFSEFDEHQMSEPSGRREASSRGSRFRPAFRESFFARSSPHRILTKSGIGFALAFPRLGACSEKALHVLSANPFRSFMKGAFPMLFTRPIRSSAIAAAAAAMLVLPSPAFAQLRISEVMSSSGVGGTADWFEVTNYGSSPVAMTGARMDDNSFTFLSSVELLGVSSIAAGDSAVFIETSTLDPAAEVAAFRTFWGGDATGAPIGYYSGSGISFSSNGDGVVVFDSIGGELTPQTSFPAATAGSSFYWAYGPTGDFVYGSQSAGVVSAVGTLAGSTFDQVTFLSANALPQNIGSIGTAAVSVPEPAGLGLAAAGLSLAGLAARHRLRGR